VAVDTSAARPGGAVATRWTVKRTTGSHRVLERPGWPDVVFAFHDSDEIGPRMLARIARTTGLKPREL